MARKDTKKPEPPPPPPTSTTHSSSDSITSSDTAASSDTSLPPTTVPTTLKRTLTPHPHQPKPDSDSDSEPESDTPPPPPKPTPKPRSTCKRPAPPDNNNNNKGQDKRPKKDTTGPSATTLATPTPQKALFQRLWSDEDEIVILKGMIEYKEKKGVDPMTHVDDFLDFIKKSLHVPDANKTQIISKVRRLKKRFINAQKKKLTDPHEITAFELSKKIWRGGEFDEGDNVEVSKKASNGEMVREERNVNVNVELGFLGEEGGVVKTAMRRMGDREKGELKKMVEKANVAYFDAYLLRLKVLEVAAMKIVEGIRNDQC